MMPLRSLKISFLHHKMSLLHAPNSQENHKTEKPINITELHKVHMKGDCIDRSFLRGNWEPLISTYAVIPGHEIFKEPRNELY